MIYTGLVSVTFRKIEAEEIVKLVSKAGLDGIEWGGDIHVPHGNAERAREVLKMTIDTGLKVAAFGSYYRVACDEVNKVGFEKVLETAVELNAPTIRVWAGNKGSKDADEAWWNKVVEESRNIADMAQKANITVSFEYHGNTLTDTPEAAKRLLMEIDHKNIYSYWQPSLGLNVEQRVESLKDISPWLSNIHTFYWVDRVRQPLADGISEWNKYFEVIGQIKGDRYSMLEFVKDESPEQFLEDAKILTKMVKI